MSSLLPTLQRLPAVYRALRRVRRAWGRAMPPLSHPGLAGRVHRNDVMMRNHTPASYRRIGEEAVSLFERGLRVAGVDPERVDAILDFGCGYGRVTRVLAARFGPARVSAFDVADEGARFCAAELGVHHVPFRGDWGAVPFASYEAIWLGSVLTHLDAQTTGDSIELLRRSLAPGGVAVVTTQGADSVRRLRAGEYGSHFRERTDAVADALAREGFCFVPYPYAADGPLGMTWMTPEFLARLAEQRGGFERLASWPAAWDAHQDVHVLRAPGKRNERTA